MRRIRFVLAGAVLALALPGGALADDEARVAVAPVRFVDAVPPGPSLEDRLAEIRRLIQEALTYPPLARWRDIDGSALVRFAIAPGGRARDVRIERSSGERILDEAALRAVELAGPLPYVFGPLEVPVHFDLRGDR